MSIVNRRVPATVRARAVTLFIGLSGRCAAEDTVGGIPLYIATAAHLLESRYPRGLQQWGWRLVRIGQESNAHVDIEGVRDAGDAYSHCENGHAAILAAYALDAERRLKKVKRKYQGRVLIIPEVQMEALWIHTPERNIPDRYYGLPASQPAWPNRGFLTEARRRAEAVALGTGW